MSNNTIPCLASIIVPCWGQLEFTAQCIAALRHHTRMPWELIAIDNGSTDHTATYLSGVRDLAAVPVTIVSNATKLPRVVRWPSTRDCGSHAANTWSCSITTSS